eukprot:4698593-Pleurochrysis_carterae.AAC.1
MAEQEATWRGCRDETHQCDETDARGRQWRREEERAAKRHRRSSTARREEAGGHELAAENDSA